MKQRYLAEWISGYDGPTDDEFDPDCYLYSRRECRTREEAERHAEKESAKGPCGGYWRVYEQVYDPSYYEPGVGDWKNIREWVEGQEVPI